VPVVRRTRTECLRHCARDERAGGDLCVERLGTGDAHLHVATVRGIDDTVGFGGEFAAAPVDDGEHACAARSGQVDSAVGVGRGAALADRDDERVAHVECETETRQFGGWQRINSQTIVGE